MWRRCLLLALLTSAIGCGRTEGPKTAVVTGKINLDGKPLETGSISFLPVDGNGVPSGAKISQGTYRADVPPGFKRVEIRAQKVVGQKEAYPGAPNSPMYDIVEELIPLRYNAQSELKTTVAGQASPVDFNLESASQ